jgi:hypothetical protein
MRRLFFRDSSDFYTTLFEVMDQASEQGEGIQVLTSYRRWEDVPRSLKRSFDLGQKRIFRCIDPRTGSFVPNSQVNIGLGRMAIAIILISRLCLGVVAGALLGLMIPPLGLVRGMAVGAALGTLMGLINATTAYRDYPIAVEIDDDGQFVLCLGSENSKPRST